MLSTTRPDRAELVRRIVIEEAVEADVTVSAIKSRSKLRILAHTRFRIAYRLKHEVGISICRIGQILNCERSSLNRGVRKLEKMLQAKHSTARTALVRSVPGGPRPDRGNDHARHQEECSDPAYHPRAAAREAQVPV